MISSESPDFVEALARGLSVLSAFDATDPEMTLAELSRKIGMPIATVRRNILTLEALGFVRRHKKHFLLAPRVLTLGSAYAKVFNLEEAVIPELQRIVSLFGDATTISVLDRTSVLPIAHLSGRRDVLCNSSFGATFPAYATSVGRVLLAALREEELARYFQAYGPLKLTDSTVTDERELRRILDETRVKGYSITVDQLDYGVTALAVPIKDDRGRVICAINSEGYTPRLAPDALIEQRLPELRVAANRLRQLLTRFPALLHSLAPPAI